MNYCETKNLSKAVMMLHDADLAYSFTKNVFHAFISAHVHGFVSCSFSPRERMHSIMNFCPLSAKVQ